MMSYVEKNTGDAGGKTSLRQACRWEAGRRKTGPRKGRARKAGERGDLGARGGSVRCCITVRSARETVVGASCEPGHDPVSMVRLHGQ